MTEAEGVNEQRRPQTMLSVLRNTRFTRTKVGRRKLRLFACACCRLTWELLTDPLLRKTVEIAEQFAEARAGKKELQRAYEGASRPDGRTSPPATHHASGRGSPPAWLATSPTPMRSPPRMI